jgi:hypothetical protein
MHDFLAILFTVFAVFLIVSLVCLFLKTANDACKDIRIIKECIQKSQE